MDLWGLEGTVISDVRSQGSGIQFLLQEESREPLGQPARVARGDASEVATPVAKPAHWLVRILGTPTEAVWPGDRIRIAAPARAFTVLESTGARRKEALHASAEFPVLHVLPDAVLRLAEPEAGLCDVLFQTFSTEWGPRPWSSRLWLLRRMAQARAALLQASQRAWSALPAWAVGGEGASAAAFVQAITLGERGALRHLDGQRQARGLPAWETQIKDAGVLHILSVSGLHMSVVGLALFAMMNAILRGLQGRLAHVRWTATWISQRWAALVSLPAVICYTLISGAEPPAVRAAAALVLFLLGHVCCRQARLPQSLAVALLWTALPLGVEGSPNNLFSPSLILSFAATLGIAYLRPLSTCFPPSLQHSRPSHATQRQCGLKAVSALAARGIRAAARLLDASLAAALATLPLLAHFFGECQGAALVGNVSVTPVAELVTLPCGLASALLALLWTPLSTPFAVLAALSARVVLDLSARIAGWRLTVPTPAPSPWLIALWFVGLLVLRHRRGWGFAVLAAALVCHLTSPLRPPRELRITFLDVGQGDAAVAELPDGGVLVVDTGRPGPRQPGSHASDGVPDGQRTDSGQVTVGPFLRRRGYRRIDLLVVSHRHPDHMGGVESLLSQFDVDVLWLARQPMQGRMDREAERLDQAEVAIRRLARQRGTLVAVPHSRALLGARLDVLSPCTGPGTCRALAQPEWQENDNSLVIALRYAGRTVLLTGDIEKAAEAALVERYPHQALRADVLKLPHHGSRTSSTEPLLRAVQPALAVASLGRHNRFGFPHPQVVCRLHEAGIPLLRTDEDGAVHIQIQQSGALLSPRLQDPPKAAAKSADCADH